MSATETSMDTKTSVKPVGSISQENLRTGVEDSMFGTGNDTRTIVYNPFDFESVFAAAILDKHFRRVKTKTLSMLKVFAMAEDQGSRHLWLGLDNTKSLQSFYQTSTKRSPLIQFMNVDRTLSVDEIGIGPSLLTCIAEEFGIRTERYEKLFYQAQRFFNRKTGLHGKVDCLAYVYINYKRALRCLENGDEYFTPISASAAEIKEYLADFKAMQMLPELNGKTIRPESGPLGTGGKELHLAPSISPAIDNGYQVTVASINHSPEQFALSRRLMKMRGLSYFNRQMTALHGTMIFTNLVKPSLASSDNEKTVLIHC